MFTTEEFNYALSLINTMKNLDYNYYICHTVTDDLTAYDVCFYFSKKEISAVSSDSFSIEEGIVIHLDSSSRSSISITSRDLLEEYSGIVVINSAEFIYTNAKIGYPLTTTGFEVNPDITLSNSNVKDTFTLNSILFVLVVIFIYTFISQILKIRR